MSAVCVYDLAKVCGLESRQLIHAGASLGMSWLKRPSDYLDLDTVKALLATKGIDGDRLQEILGRLTFDPKKSEITETVKRERIFEALQRGSGPFVLPNISIHKGSGYTIATEYKTAEEKVAYYELVAENGGLPPYAKLGKDFERRARSCQLKADEARKAGKQELADYLVGCAANNTQRVKDCEMQAEEDSIWEDPITPEKRRLRVRDALEEANFWKTIHEWPVEYAMEKTFNRQTESDVLFVRAQKCRFALSMLASRGDFKRLQDLVEMGIPGAAKVLVDLTKTMVETLNASARRQPEAYEHIATHEASWPTIYSVHPKLREDVVQLMKKIKCGEGVSFVLDGRADWDPKEPWCNVAIALFYHIDELRQKQSSPSDPPYGPDARKLRKFDRHTSDSWWSVAKRALLHSYPKPEEILHLRNLVTDQTAMKSAGRIKQRILERLRIRFLKLSP